MLLHVSVPGHWFVLNWYMPGSAAGGGVGGGGCGGFRRCPLTQRNPLRLYVASYLGLHFWPTARQTRRPATVAVTVPDLHATLEAGKSVDARLVPDPIRAAAAVEAARSRQATSRRRNLRCPTSGERLDIIPPRSRRIFTLFRRTKSICLYRHVVKPCGDV